MADYKELLRRAIAVLPENNGGARRAVYEKARTALVAQLRAIDPPLAAREITQHRLQLEDCIRQVEQEASEAAISGLKTQEVAAAPEPEPQPVAVSKPVVRPPEPTAEAPKSKAAEPVAKPRGRSAHKKEEASADSIADIIAAAEAAAVVEPEAETKRPPLPAKAAPDAPAKPKSEPRPMPTIVARAESARQSSSAPAVARPTDSGRRGPVIEPRREGGQQAAAARLEPVRAPNHRPEPALRTQTATVQQLAPARFEEPELGHAEVAHLEPESGDPQGVIDRAIAVLDQEARGDLPEIEAEPKAKPARAEKGRGKVVPIGTANDDRPIGVPAFADLARSGRQAERPAARGRAKGESRGISALTIFFGVFGVLLVGALGAGFWAWNEGFINFGGTAQPVAEAPASGERTLDVRPVETVAVAPVQAQPAAAPAAPPSAESAAAAISSGNDRLAPSESGPAPLALQPNNAGADLKSEERLSVAAAPSASPAIAPAPDASAIAGSQSLLLEASDGGNTGAVPFTGEVEWSKGVDEMGQPTLVAKAKIPARNLSVDVLIRKNSDQSLPASHLMEINFSVSETFIGGAIASLPGVLLKNEELVQGVPLVGASARVVGNSFLFALSASANDATVNQQLLTSRKWMDLALVYATGKRAIITLEKDEAAQALFTEVFDAWRTASN